jgi:hypothetical protein
VFAGGLTDVEVTLTVRDSETGKVTSYHNPQGTPYQPVQDTSAFATCSSARTSSPADTGGASESEPRDLSKLLGEWAASRPLAGKGGQTAGAGSCTASSTVACLNHGRFRVTARYDSGTGNSGEAQVVQLTPDTGYFWFFASSNVEALVKVLDGCSVGGHYWVFSGGLTDVKVDLTVADTVTGASRTYSNPLHTQFQPIQDTSAFATCP